VSTADTEPGALERTPRASLSGKPGVLTSIHCTPTLAPALTRATQYTHTDSNSEQPLIDGHSEQQIIDSREQYSFGTREQNLISEQLAVILSSIYSSLVGIATVMGILLL